mgnify:CR=1 FL=1
MGRYEEIVMKYSRIVVAITGMVFFAMACGSGGGDVVKPEFDTNSGIGTLNISMDDFKFTPERIDLIACQKVRVILTNNSTTNDHGFTVGYGVKKEGGSSTGFETDWLDEIEVAVIGPAKSVSSGGAILTREGDENITNGTSGFMVTKAPSSQATIIEFTVPATVGDFEFASFEGGGKHYEDGMKGLIKVFPAELPRKGWAGNWRSAPDKCPS